MYCDPQIQIFYLRGAAHMSHEVCPIAQRKLWDTRYGGVQIASPNTAHPSFSSVAACSDAVVVCFPGGSRIWYAEADIERLP